jgi:formate dehydrogenase
MAKILSPETGHPPRYARDSIPRIIAYANDQTASTPHGLGFAPSELGLRPYLEGLGHELIVTSDKDGQNSESDRHLSDAEIVISQPFWPANLSANRIAKAPTLKLALTSGIGFDHTDLDAAAKAGITVADVTDSNSISVAKA